MFDQLKGKTLLVTGATGFIGSHLLRRLQQLPASRIVVLSRQPKPAAPLTNMTWVTTALGDLSTRTWQGAGVEKVDIIFHLASFTPKTGAAGDDIERVYADNLLGTRTLLDTLPACPTRVVLSSTLDVYALPEAGAILSEVSPISPQSLYGASKFFCEQLVRTYARAQGFDYAILRYGHIFGPGEEAYGKLIPITIRQLLKGEAPVLYGDGSAGRDYLFVGDAIEATLRAANSTVSALEPVNIVRGESRSSREIVETLIAITGFSGGIKFLTDKPNGYTLRFDSSRMRDLLGTWPLTSLEAGLKQQVEHCKLLNL